MNKIRCPYCEEVIDASLKICPFCCEELQPIEQESIVCPYCNQEISANSKFCPFCGEKVELYNQAKICSFCNKSIPADSNYCQFCGSHLLGKRNKNIEKNPPKIPVEIHSQDKTTKNCPFCGEEIGFTDEQCPICGENLSEFQEEFKNNSEKILEEKDIKNILVQNKTTKNCPFCGEEIGLTDEQCPICGENLSEFQEEFKNNSEEISEEKDIKNTLVQNKTTKNLPESDNSLNNVIENVVIPSPNTDTPDTLSNTQNSSDDLINNATTIPEIEFPQNIKDSDNMNYTEKELSVDTNIPNIITENLCGDSDIQQETYIDKVLKNNCKKNNSLIFLLVFIISVIILLIVYVLSIAAKYD